MSSSRKLVDLHPKVAQMCMEFIVRCRCQGIEILVYCTYRDEESQAELYAQGRTKPGIIVTNARPGESWHNWRCAFDFVPMVNGKPAWNDSKLYLQCGSIAESVGLEWAGRWRRFRELAHCQYTGGNTIKKFQAGIANMSKLA